jgi:hypothetical protein
MVITQQRTENMEYVRRLLRQNSPDFPWRWNCGCVNLDWLWRTFRDAGGRRGMWCPDRGFCDHGRRAMSHRAFDDAVARLGT